jgi:acyl-CoA synthetase (AMP-forming)/AMP-acid ligase II
MKVSLQGMISRAARLNPNGECVKYKGVGRSWSQSCDRISKIASGLRGLGLVEGDRVAILSLNSANYYEFMFAPSWAGFCIVPLNTRWAVPENEYALDDSGAKVLAFDDSFSEQAKQLLQTVSTLEHAIFIGEGDCPEWAIDVETIILECLSAPMSARGSDDMAGIFYTGGTTGFPKGVMLSHGAIYASGVSALAEFETVRESRYLHVAPMFHVADLCGSIVATLRCASHVIVQGFEPAEVLDTIEKERVTCSLMVPSMVKVLLNHPNTAETDVSSLKMLYYGASPMPATTLMQCMEMWPHVGLAQAYGQTELAPIASLLSREDHLKGGELLRSAGRPSAVSDVRCIREDGNECLVGEPGEIVVRGPNCMIGYWNKPEQTNQTMVDGWVHTGDAGYINDDGYLFIVDRVKDMIITGGENVYTSEVENVLMSHCAVQDVAVIGIPSEEWGESVHAIVILKPGFNVTEDEIKIHCRDRIAGYKIPKSIGFRDQPLPLSGAGKVLKTELRRPFWEGLERQVG